MYAAVRSCVLYVKTECGHDWNRYQYLPNLGSVTLTLHYIQHRLGKNPLYFIWGTPAERLVIRGITWFLSSTERQIRNGTCCHHVGPELDLLS
jgi:hypothetical protein